MCPRNWTIMFHLLEHMPAQIRQWGPPRDTWMFSMESFFGKLVRMIKNQHHPIANVMRTYSISKAVNLCIALMSHGLEKHRHGYVAPIRLPPCITPVDRTARLGEQNHTGFLSRELWQDLIVFLKKTDEWKELKELHRIGRQGAEARYYIQLHLLACGVHTGYPLVHPVTPLCTLYAPCTHL